MNSCISDDEHYWECLSDHDKLLHPCIQIEMATGQRYWECCSRALNRADRVRWWKNNNYLKPEAYKTRPPVSRVWQLFETWNPFGGDLFETEPYELED